MRRMYLYNRINNSESCLYIEDEDYDKLAAGCSLADAAPYLTQPQLAQVIARLDAEEFESIEVTPRHHTLQEYGRN